MNQEAFNDPVEQEFKERHRSFESTHPQMYDYVRSMTDTSLSKEQFFEMADFVNTQRTELPLEGSYKEVHFRINGVDRRLTAKVFENGRVTVSVSASE